MFKFNQKINNKEECKITPNNSSSFFKKASITVLILILLLVSFFSGMYISVSSDVANDFAKKEVVELGKLTGKYNEDEEGRLSQDINFELYWDLWDSLKRRHVDKGEISEKEMFYGSLKGLAASLGDPYTVFLEPVEAKAFADDLAGTFEGIGAEVGLRDNVLTVIAPLDGMPAQEAGLMAGDKILEVDGTSTMDMSVDQAVRIIRGEKDTKVVLTIYREGLTENKKIEITRGVIHVKSVKFEIRDDGIYVIKISHFNSDTIDLFDEAVREIQDKNPKGIILDLRNNPGGYLETSIEVASEWIENDIVVKEKLSSGNEKKYKSRGIPRLKDFKTVVLVNSGSASASEIVAGALKDHNKALILGTQTYGKGSVQSLEDFSDGSSLKITVAKWFTPNGESINDEGVTPDEEIELTFEDFEADIDPQMDKAIETLIK